MLKTPDQTSDTDYKTKNFWGKTKAKNLKHSVNKKLSFPLCVKPNNPKPKIFEKNRNIY